MYTPTDGIITWVWSNFNSPSCTFSGRLNAGEKACSGAIVVGSDWPQTLYWPNTKWQYAEGRPVASIICTYMQSTSSQQAIYNPRMTFKPI